MEFLNNIWIALSTPNESLVNILVLPFGIIENLLTMYFFITIFEIQSSSKQKFYYITFMTMVGFFSSFSIFAPYNIFFNYIMVITLATLIFKISILKSILACISSGLLFAIVGLLISNPFLNILNITSNMLVSIPMYKLTYSVFLYIIIFGIFFLLKTNKIVINLLDEIDYKNKLIISFNIIIGFITLITQSILIFYYIDFLPPAFTLLIFATLLSYFIISIYSLTRIIKLMLTTKKLESTEEYNNTLKILHDNVRCFKHDFDNIVTTIGGYIRTNDMEGLKKYYLQLEDDCQKVNNLYVLNPEIVNNDGIYNLIVKKYNEAEQKNVKVNISFLLDLNTLKMKIYEFGRILGILLDNAIEASSECEEKIINLTFRNDTKNSRQLVKIENTYSNKNVDTEKIFEKGISGKENHTGLGLWEVNKLLHKNNNLALFTTKNDKYFSQQLEIYY